MFGNVTELKTAKGHRQSYTSGNISQKLHIETWLLHTSDGKSYIIA